MALNLSKSAPAINLSKSAPALLKGLTLGLQWDGDADLDVTAIQYKGGIRLGNIVGYPMLERDSMGVYTGGYNYTVQGFDYSGDALDGSADGYDETININLSEVEGEEIILYLTSYSESEPMTFGESINPEAILTDNTGKELASIKLDQDAAFGTAFQMLRVFKEGSDWKIENNNQMVGSSNNGLQDVMNLSINKAA